MIFCLNKLNNSLVVCIWCSVWFSLQVVLGGKIGVRLGHMVEWQSGWSLVGTIGSLGQVCN